MKRLTSLVCLSLVVLLAGSALAAKSSRDLSGYNVADGRYAQIYTGQPVGSKVDPDTVYLMGGPSRTDGKFQSGSGGVLPDRQGWTGVDLTIKTVCHWNIDTYNGLSVLDPAFTPNHVMWCGQMLTSCGTGDDPQGYANGYNEWLDFYGTVTNNAVATNVTVTCKLNDDSEQDYDYLAFEVSRVTGQNELIRYSGSNPGVNFSQTFTVSVADYVGGGANQIHLRFKGYADGGWSDSDCRRPSKGLAQLDNIQVTTDNGLSAYDNFEGGTVHWAVAFPPAAGDFGHVWPRLTDLDPCNSDDTPLFAWVDDGLVVPGTGGYPGVTWTYGPGGYVFNHNGGLAGPGYHVTNEVWSPALAWPTSGTKQYTGLDYNFIAYRHLPLANGIFYVWHVRASTDGGATWGDWADRNFVYYGTAADFLNIGNTVTDLLPNTRTHVQLAFGAEDYGWVWGYKNTDCTPAPYFDNVRALAYVFPGPAMSLRDIDIFQSSNFPAIGTIDRVNLGNNSVRIDMANNISPRTHLRNDPGDSIVVTVSIVRTGSVMQGVPRMHYRLHRNPLFDAYRTSGLPDDGWVNGDTTKTGAGAPPQTTIPNSWRWDMPDTGFFFPGDVLHYYFEAQDNLAGNIGTTRLPGDTTGFSLFPGMTGYKPLQFNSTFIVRALPSMTGAAVADQPKILFWNDFANRGGENEWVGALTNLGYREGTDYDEYYTNGPSSGVGNGLGGRATGPQLAGYSTMLYTSGDLGSYTFSNGDYKSDPGNDTAVMTAWLSQGGKKLYATGDDLAYDLGRSGAANLAFRNTFMPMTFNQTDVRPLIQNQINPIVDPVAANPVGLTHSYIAYGGCQVFNKFDAVQATTGSTRIATFRQLSGAAYPYAAALYFANAGGYGDDIVYMPYDFMYIYKMPNTAKAPAAMETRALVLQQILTFFGNVGTSPVTGVETPGLAFSAKNYPNPFNPSTKIEYTLTRPGQVSVKIYNVRGELVRTLLDGQVQSTSGSVTWLGDNDRGAKVASGVYFYQVKTADNEVFNKMTLVK